MPGGIIKGLIASLLLCLSGHMPAMAAVRDVTSYGATGNGVTDDTGAIQSAINASGSGDVVYFPSGTYRITAKIYFKNGVDMQGDSGGVSTIKADSPHVAIGDPDNVRTLNGLIVEDLFFLDVSLEFLSTACDNNLIRRCIFASDEAETANWFLATISRGQNNTMEDCIFMAGIKSGGATWAGNWIKGLSSYKGNNLLVQRCIFGIDLGNLTWLDTEWAGYANVNDIENRLTQFKSAHNLPRRMGTLGGGIRLNESDGSVIDKCIFHCDPIACEVPQDVNNLDVDHLIYATQSTNLEITRNWFSGHPPNPGGGVKHRDTHGPGVIAANYLLDTPIILYTYDNDLTHDFRNQLIYRNHLKITDFDTIAGMGMRLGIWFWSTDIDELGFDGENIDVAGNVFDVDPQSKETDAPIDITNAKTGPSDWRIYTSNTYLDSGNVIPIVGNGSQAPYTHTSGSPSAATWNLAEYDAMQIPFLEIPPFGTDPPSNNAPTFTTNPVIETDAEAGAPYSSSIADDASDADGDPLTFSKISGPGWLNVATNGVITGTPASLDIGLNSFTVQVSDGIDVDTADLSINVLAAPGSSVTVNFNPTDDTYSDQNSPSVAMGGNTFILLRNSSTKERNGYLKFSLSGISGPVTSARLKVYVQDDLIEDVSARTVADTSWTESTLTWNNAPAFGTVIDTVASLSVGNWYELDVTSAISGNGTYSLALTTTDTTLYNKLDSREAVNDPVLEVTYQTGPANNAPVFTADPIVEAGAVKGSLYGSTIADDASDADGDPIIFSRMNGPSWLAVATNGVLSGTPGSADVGLNSWQVLVTDGAATNTATMEITVASDGDWDDDGIADDWELLHYGHETNAVATADEDNDGFDTLSEYIGGFNPTNGLFYPKVNGLELVPGGSTFVITWEAPMEGRMYDVMWSSSLTGSFTAVESGILFPQNSYTGAVQAAEPVGFYRIEYKLQP